MKLITLLMDEFSLKEATELIALFPTVSINAFEAFAKYACFEVGEGKKKILV